MKTKQMLLAMEVYCTYLNNCSNRARRETVAYPTSRRRFLCLKLSTKEYLSVDPWVSEDYDDDNFIKRFGEEVE